MEFLRWEIEVLLQSVEYFPFPAWVKGIDGEAIFVNSAWEAHFIRGEVPENPIEALPPNRRRDSEVRDSQVIQKGLWLVWEDPDGLVVKWPVRKAGEVVAVGGMLVPDSIFRCFAEKSVSHHDQRSSLTRS